MSSDVWTDFIPHTVLTAKALNGALRLIQADADAAQTAATTADALSAQAKAISAAAQATANAAQSAATSATAAAAAALAAAQAAQASANAALAAVTPAGNPVTLAQVLAEIALAQAATNAATTSVAAANTASALAQTESAAANTVSSGAEVAAAAAQATANEALAIAEAAGVGNAPLYPPSVAMFSGGWQNPTGSGGTSGTVHVTTTATDTADGITIVATQMGSGEIPTSSTPGAQRLLTMPMPTDPGIIEMAIDLAAFGPGLQGCGIAWQNSATGAYHSFGFSPFGGMTDSAPALVGLTDYPLFGYGLLEWHETLDGTPAAAVAVPVVVAAWPTRAAGLLWLRLHSDGTTYTITTSDDGIRWVGVATGALTEFSGTPDTVAIALLCAPGLASPPPLTVVIKSWRFLPDPTALLDASSANFTLDMGHLG